MPYLPYSQKKMIRDTRIKYSKDPSGFIFTRDNDVYRQVNSIYKLEYRQLMESGLYEELVSKKMLIPHEEIRTVRDAISPSYKIIKPVQIPFISYPFEWPYSGLKDAALLTLQVQKTALKYGMSLKDADARNIQFLSGMPIFIDTLSFEKYLPGSPWIPYKQICEHFLGPLALASRTDIRLSNLLRIYPNGIPLDLVSSLLPLKTWLNPYLLTHLHLHSASIARIPNSIKKSGIRHQTLPQRALIALIENLEHAVNKLKPAVKKGQWFTYYQHTNYTPAALRHKTKLIQQHLSRIKPRIVWDMGANTGIFSEIASKYSKLTVSFDSDYSVSEYFYRNLKTSGNHKILPLCLDLLNPTPKLGFGLAEMYSLIDRGPADVVLVLALVHHLAIMSNVPFERLAEFFSRISKWLIIEFVPKSDSQLKKMLLGRNDIFFGYSEKNFEKVFANYYSIESRIKIQESGRSIYLMKTH